MKPFADEKYFKLCLYAIVAPLLLITSLQLRKTVPVSDIIFQSIVVSSCRELIELSDTGIEPLTCD